MSVEASAALADDCREGGGCGAYAVDDVSARVGRSGKREIAHLRDGVGAARRHGIERTMCGRLRNAEHPDLGCGVLAEASAGDLPSLENRSRLGAQPGKQCE